MSTEGQLTAIFYTMIAALLSTVIGLERERRSKPAGLRTHILVGIGACLFTTIGNLAFRGDTRIAANVITGVGFLGAGVIFKTEDGVHDLTTAASIWVTAAVGMAAGLGAWLLATISVLIIWFVLNVLWHLERR